MPAPDADTYGLPEGYDESDEENIRARILNAPLPLDPGRKPSKSPAA